MYKATDSSGGTPCPSLTVRPFPPRQSALADGELEVGAIAVLSGIASADGSRG